MSEENCGLRTIVFKHLNEMRTLLILIRKEFLQIFRNKAILAIIFVMPVVQLLVLPLAASYEIKDVKVAIVDHDKSTYSRELIRKVTGSGYFKITDYGENYAKAYSDVETEKADLIIEIPNNFEKNLVKENQLICPYSFQLDQTERNYNLYWIITLVVNSMGQKIPQGVLEVIVIRFSLFIRNIQRRILMKWKSQRGS